VRALQIDAWGGPLEERDLPRPELGPGEVRLRVLACGVGLTVQNAINGVLSGDGRASLPRVPGHELCAEVIEVAPDVHSLEVGDRGVTYSYLTCGVCRFCRHGNEALCLDWRGFVGVDVDGGYAEETVLPARSLIRIPDMVDPVEATTIPDAISTSVHICNSRAHVRPGAAVVVVGAGGGVGIHLVQVARLFGGDVLAVDISKEKLDYAREAGATATLQSGSPPGDVTKALGRQADVVVDFVGNDDTLAWSAAALGRGGKLIVLTVFPGQKVSELTARLVLEEISIVGSRYASYAEVELAAWLLAAGKVRAMIGARGGLSDVPRLHEQLRSQTLLGRGALVL
jgi:D-arabinose 1-dehydrogenase-like Zn-dependent alcohol dehydrogenase